MRRIAAARLRYCGLETMAADVMVIVSELLTNALLHSGTTEISLTIAVADDTLRIAVRDGMPGSASPRTAADEDESGRGLLLVNALAAERGGTWGTSDDGTTTWCTLPLTEGLPNMQPAAATAPVLREIRMDLPADPSASALARIQARTLLTMLGWPGNQHLALDVLHVLIDNAVHHALTPGKTDQHLGACLSVTEAHELLIDVTDPAPTFPDFDQAIAGELGRGLWDIVRQGACVTWFVPSDFDGKTVRAALRPGPVDL
ncbi:ATP-binding protein [Streptomyces sp. NPDC096152]|uniref:ATP-binding protein n=1 Tax=Streptomyces sp. NPDC096152 TaxID=3366078 RepID=UPI003822FB44